MKVCPKGAITIPCGITAKIDTEKCVGCGLCAKACPASVIHIEMPRRGEEDRNE
jgi:Fe-S-cluster-containing hydrogenase component 2